MTRFPRASALACLLAPLLVSLLSVGCGHGRQGLAARPFIRNVKFRGAEHASASELRKGLVNQETSWLTITRKRYYSPSALADDKQRVAAWYAAHGFFEARVTGTEVKPRWRNSVDLYFDVEEGAGSHITEVRVNGLEALGTAGAAMKRELGIAAGDRFDHDRYLQAKGTLLQLLRSAGRAWAEVTGRAEVDRAARQVLVVLDATPGPEVRFGAVEVDGAHAVAERLIVLEADLPVGQRFQPQALELARSRLHNLGVFSTVRVEPQRNPARPDEAVVRITVVEDPRPRQLRLGLGLGIEAQRTEVHARLPITWNNWMGGLRKLELRVEAGYVAQPAFWQPERHGPQGTVELRLTQPHVPWAHAQTRVAVAWDLGIEYAFSYHGPRLELGATYGVLHNHLRFGLSYGFQLLDLFHTPCESESDPAAKEQCDRAFFADPEKAGRLFGYVDPYRLGWLQGQVTLDWRDQAIGARRGLFLEVSAEKGAWWMGGAFDYWSVLVDGRGYIPLGRRVVVALRARYGHLFVPDDSALGSPITRHFYSGGPSSHRGFTFNRLSPTVPAGAEMKLIPVGGDEVALGQVEVRVDLFRLFGSWVSAAAFCDAGDVVEAGRHVDLAQLHLAAGGGLRYNTIIGAIRFDFGYRINRVGRDAEPDGRTNPDPNDRYAFHLSIGEAF